MKTTYLYLHSAKGFRAPLTDEHIATLFDCRIGLYSVDDVRIVLRFLPCSSISFLHVARLFNVNRTPFHCFYEIEGSSEPLPCCPNLVAPCSNYL